MRVPSNIRQQQLQHHQNHHQHQCTRSPRKCSSVMAPSREHFGGRGGAFAVHHGHQQQQQPMFIVNQVLLCSGASGGQRFCCCLNQQSAASATAPNHSSPEYSSVYPALPALPQPQPQPPPPPPPNLPPPEYSQHLKSPPRQQLSGNKNRLQDYPKHHPNPSKATHHHRKPLTNVLKGILKKASSSLKPRLGRKVNFNLKPLKFEFNLDYFDPNKSITMQDTYSTIDDAHNDECGATVSQVAPSQMMDQSMDLSMKRPSMDGLFQKKTIDLEEVDFDPVTGKRKCGVHVLMPNGTLISLSLVEDTTFVEIKDEIFELSQRGPMYGVLRDPKSYTFSYIDREVGNQKEVKDEEIRLCDVSPFCGILRLVEQKDDMAAQELDEQIGRLIGKSLKDFDALRNPEVNEFRYRMRSLCEDIVKTRQANSWIEKMKYAFPCSVEQGPEVPDYLKVRIPEDGFIPVKVSFERPKLTVDLSVHHQVTAEELITLTIRQLMCNPQYQEVYDKLVEECEAESYYDTSFASDEPVTLIGANYYLLKINGCLEYLLGNHRLVQYKMIQRFILNDEVIHLVAIRRHSIEFEDESIYSVPEFLPPSARSRSQSVISLGSLSNIIISTRRRPQIFSSWVIERKLVLRIHAATRITFGADIQRIAIMVGIFHGGEMLCDHFMTQPMTTIIGNSKNASHLSLLDAQQTTLTFELDVVFTLKVSDLPRMARLCFSVVGFTSSSGASKKLSKSSSVNQPSSKLCWGNINFFDYRGILRESPTTLSLWPVDPDEDSEDLCGGSFDSKEHVAKFFNPLGTVVPNPATDCPLLTISFTKYSEGDNTIIRFPEIREIVKVYKEKDALAVSTPNLGSFPEEGSQDDELMDPVEGEEEDEYDSSQLSPAPLHRSASTSSTSSIRSAWARKQSVAIDKIDVAEPRLTSRPKGHASKQFLSKFTPTLDPIPEEEEEEEEEEGPLKLSTQHPIPNPNGTHSKDALLEQINDFCDRDLLYRMTDQECELLWMLREDCRRQLPNALNKMLISFKWNNQKLVGQALALMHTWPKVKADKALELLDYAYPDLMVRKYAIECLKDITNDQLYHFLLQLVQALKYESYIYNDLVQFLLERAFENQRIGHHLFWLLRSEMHDPAVSVMFGLILEAYCRGAVDHIHILTKQMECLTKLKRINEIIRDDKSRENRDKKISQMQDILAQKYYQETLSNVINPLDPVYKLGALKVKKCKFMDSKMKPLWLVFENPDETAGDLYLIFKNGDDLRQDMLTLQMIRIMDHLWKESGLDLRMTPYRCISVAHNVGLIEVVLNADTIANIQKGKGSAAIAAFKKASLFQWLRENNPGEEELGKAIDEFTKSTAGYCVATYILGIADRHSDNIMIKKNGQLFHIDFGHILGKFKEKFGIRRERVPFVLTNDFVYVITHGDRKKNEKSDHFARFQEYCEEAFLIIRRKGNFIISLFAMMLSTGIPEISSVEDLQYLRETLVLDLNEDQARIHFRTKFTDALRNSWKTSFNWMAHSIAKDNRME